MNNSFKIGFALLVVLAIGGFAGILLAPAEGTETRKKLSKKGKKLWKNTKETASDLLERSSTLKNTVLEEGGKLVS